MKPTREYEIALVTAPDLGTARSLAQTVLEARLAACVNLVPQVESHFWWQGRLDQSSEVLMVIKTITEKLPDLEKLVLTHHPYDTPEFLVLSLTAGNERYLEWLKQSVSG